MTAMLAPVPTAEVPDRPVPRHRRLRLRPVRGLRTVTHLRPRERPPQELPVSPPLPSVRLVELAPRTSAPAVRGGRAKEQEIEAPPLATHLRSLEVPKASPGQVCASILQVAGEAMRGVRPLVQLSRWVDEQVFSELARFAPRHGSRTSTAQRVEPEATASLLARAKVQRLKVARISPTVAECTALVLVDERVRAVVVRLEVHRDRWRATTLQAL